MIRIPSGYKIIQAAGWVREPIGYKPLPDPGHPDYNPFIKPERVYDNPKRYIDVVLIDERISNEIRIWDDGSEEFNKTYAKVAVGGINDSTG